MMNFQRTFSRLFLFILIGIVFIVPIKQGKADTSSLNSLCNSAAHPFVSVNSLTVDQSLNITNNDAFACGGEFYWNPPSQYSQQYPQPVCYPMSLNGSPNYDILNSANASTGIAGQLQLSPIQTGGVAGDLPPIFSPGIMRLSPGFVHPAA